MQWDQFMKKYQVKRAMILMFGYTILALSLVSPVFAQCVSTAAEQRNAAQSYLIRMTQIEQQPVDANAYAGAHYDRRMAKFEVLKVYKGDSKTLSKLGNAELVVHCGTAGGPDCRILQEGYYPFYETQQMVIYEAPDINGEVTLKVGPCPGTQRLMADVNEVALFETRYHPIWVSETWCRENPQSEDCTGLHKGKAAQNKPDETDKVQKGVFKVDDK